MPYTPTNWQTGDIITAEKLNNLENGVAGGGGGSSDAFEVIFTVERDDETESLIATCDKTFSEISAAFSANKKIYAWLYDTGYEQTLLSNAQSNNTEQFIFSFADIYTGSSTKYIITINSESVNVIDNSTVSPVYLGSSYSSGDRLEAADLARYNAASLVFIGLLFRVGSIDNAGVFVFDPLGNIPDGYCFAGTPGAIGATASIDSETGLITVTPPNS